MTLRFRAETWVPAPPDAVWSVLAALPQWSDWNTVAPVAPAALELGATWRLALLARGATRHARVKVVACEPGRALAWRGGVPGLMDVVHGFTLHAADEGCLLVHHESFSGLLTPLVPWVLGREHGAMYGAVNARLAEVVGGARTSALGRASKVE